MMWVILLIFLPLLLAEAFFALSEIALVSANPRRLQRRAAEGSRGAAFALKLLKTPERLVATCLLGANLAEISNTVLMTALLITWFGPRGELMAALTLPPLILLLAEITPKSIGRQHPNRLASRVGFPLWVTSWLLAPLTLVFAGASRLFLRLTGARRRQGLPFITREDLRLVVATGGPEVDLERGERRIIHRILRFSQRRAREVMVPLVKVAAIPDTLTIAQALEEFRTSPFARLPVYQRRIDNIIGVVHGFDLLGEPPSERPIRPLIRPVPYVPEIKKTDSLLTEMQRQGIHLAVVVDEYGGAVGIVTLEDLLEEIVGEIADEFDQEASPFTRVAENRYLIDARMEISALNETLNLNLPMGDYETLAGFLIAQSGDLPRTGQVVEWGGLRFIIRRAEPRAVREVELVLPSPPERWAYFDCFSGLSGDMTLGALLEAGLPLDELRRVLAGLGLPGLEVEVRRVSRQHLAGTQVEFSVGPQPERSYREIVALLEAADLPPRTRELSLSMFRLLGEAESRRHGVPLEAVHFHELGAADTILDIVGAAFGVEYLKISRSFVSPLPLGRGLIASAHGTLPNPAPATLDLLQGFSLYGTDLPGELVTPTGAVILKGLEAESTPCPPLKLLTVGYGAGSRDFPHHPNLVRLLVGEPLSPLPGLREEVLVLETHIDDMNPELYEPLLTELFAAGALDVALTPLLMKKNRPGIAVTVIAPPAFRENLLLALFTHSTTLGVRCQVLERVAARRWQEEVATPFGPVTVKVMEYGGLRRRLPEYEVCRRLAQAHGLPVLEVYRRLEGG